MRPALLAAAAVLIAAPAFAETRSYDIKGFKKIEANVLYEIEFKQGPFYSVTVDSQYDNLDKVIIEKRGDTLVITRPQNTNLKHKVRDIVRITAPKLDALNLNSVVTFTAPSLDVDKLDIDANAVVTIDIARLNAGSVNLNAGAASKITLAGRCSKFNIELGAATTVNADDLRCRETNVDAGTASTVRAYASDRASATAAIASKVLISGRPKVFTKSETKLASHITLVD